MSAPTQHPHEAGHTQVSARPRTSTHRPGLSGLPDLHGTLRELERIACALHALPVRRPSILRPAHPHPVPTSALPQIMVTIPSTDELRAGHISVSCRVIDPGTHRIPEDIAEDVLWVEQYGAWGASEKGKWRAIIPDQVEADVVAGAPDECSVSAGNHPVPASSPPQASPEHYHIYDPLTAPEFLAGSSTSLVARSAPGYHSRPRSHAPRPPLRPRAAHKPARPGALLIPRGSAHDLWLAYTCASSSSSLSSESATPGCPLRSPSAFYALAPPRPHTDFAMAGGRSPSLDRLAPRRPGQTALRHAVSWSPIAMPVPMPMPASMPVPVPMPVREGAARRTTGALRHWFKRLVR